MRSLILLLALSVSACAPGTFNPTIDSTFTPYLESIQSHADIHGAGPNFTRVSSVIFVEDFGGNPWDAFCQWREVNGTIERVISVSRKHWNFAGHNYRLILLAHELRHCYYKDMEHDNSMVDFKGHQVPKNISYFASDIVAQAIDNHADLFDYYMSTILKK